INEKPNCILMNDIFETPILFYDWNEPPFLSIDFFADVLDGFAGFDRPVDLFARQVSNGHLLEPFRRGMVHLKKAVRSYPQILPTEKISRACANPRAKSGDNHRENAFAIL